MDYYYYVCECGLEYFLVASEVVGKDAVYCGECGEEKMVDELKVENVDELPYF